MTAMRAVAPAAEEVVGNSQPAIPRGLEAMLKQQVMHRRTVA